MKKKLEKAIDEFLESPASLQFGEKINPQDVDALRHIVNELVRIKYNQSFTEVPLIQAVLIDRTRYESPIWNVVPRWSYTDKKSLIEALHITQVNAEGAMGQLKSVVEALTYMESKIWKTEDYE